MADHSDYDRPTYVYRLTTDRGVLLYVGIAEDVGRRFQDHGKLKPWWPAVAHVDLERFPSRHLALDAERRAIVNEKPLHNVVHNADNDGRDGAVRWFCKSCLLEISSGGQVVANLYKAREHLRVYLTGVSFSHCPEPGMVDPYHDRCIPFVTDAKADDGRIAYLTRDIDDLRSRVGVMEWVAGLTQYEEIGGTYASFLIAQALGVLQEEEA